MIKNISKIVAVILFFCLFISQAKADNPAAKNLLKVSSSVNDLQFLELARQWDEAMPLGNAVVGSLIWEKENALRFSLDRIDLWDLRPSDSLSGPNVNFEWIYEHVISGNYQPVQNKFDKPYNQFPAPSKIPGASLEFSLEKVGKPQSVRLFLNNALCEATWANGMHLQTFVHAHEPVGWFQFTNMEENLDPELISPVYEKPKVEIKDNNSHAGSDLHRLGYENGKITNEGNLITYHQKGWGDFYYDVAVKWERKGKTLTGVWSVTSSLVNDKATNLVEQALKRGIQKDYISHMTYWSFFWKQSSINIPDPVLAKQYANEMYKFGSASRENSYPISLQAVWTADNGKLPPWKGDYHHDLNTQLSYWPSYTGNHLSEGLGYLNTLWGQREKHRKYTKSFFGKEGVNVPGVATLQGDLMSGWAQYTMSPTISAWLSYHFYLHYKYSADKQFLKDRAYPYIKDVATFLEQFTYLDDKGVRQLPLSSSPEIFGNNIKAWFRTITNYDLALIHFVFNAASELALELSFLEEAKHWKSLSAQLPAFDLDEMSGMTFAKGFPYNASHRHFSHLMAIHPLGIIDYGKGEEDRKIINATINDLDTYGPDQWCGYSYSWHGNLKARAMDGDGAATALKIFAECFCLKNTFHVNGDQSKTGKSKYTYRPFTLEGNFAFAAGIQEMLIQSHTGVIRIFPAIPASWKDVSFNKLRTYGAFLVSAEQKNGVVKQVTITSEKGGLLRIANPFSNTDFKLIGGKSDVINKDGFIEIAMSEGQTLTLAD